MTLCQDLFGAPARAPKSHKAYISTVSALSYAIATPVSLKKSLTFNERWLHERISENPDLLGLPGTDLTVRDAERVQQAAGRLDLLIQDTANNTRYEVEVQLGSTDPSHIIRTIEYWDNERTYAPGWNHVAVLVAEDVTSRFQNVIRLFNKTIPIIAIQLNALEVDGKLILNSTTVLNLSDLTTEEEDAGREVTRADWERRASSASLALMDRLLQLVREAAHDPTLSLNYRLAHIGMARHGIVDNFVAFHPRKKGNWVLMDFDVPRTEELTAQLEEQGFDIAMGYNPRRLRLRITDADLAVRQSELTKLIEAAAYEAKDEGAE